MKDDKATSVENAPRMTRDETPAAAVGPVAAVATAAPTGTAETGKSTSAKKASARKSAAKKAAPARAVAKESPRSATATSGTRKAAAGKSSAREASARKASARKSSARKAAGSPAVASAPKAAARPAVAKPPVARPPVAKAAAPKASAPRAPEAAEVARKALPTGIANAASSALQAALRGARPSGGVIPTAQAALAPFTAALETGAEQARNVLGRARDNGESVQQAVAESAAAAANGMLELNGKVIDLLRAQSDAAFELWRSALTAGSLSEAVRVQTSGLRQAYEATATHAKDVAATATRAIGDTVKPLQSALAGAAR